MCLAHGMDAWLCVCDEGILLLDVPSVSRVSRKLFPHIAVCPRPEWIIVVVHRGIAAAIPLCVVHLCPCVWLLLPNAFIFDAEFELVVRPMLLAIETLGVSQGYVGFVRALM